MDKRDIKHKSLQKAKLIEKYLGQKSIAPRMSSKRQSIEYYKSVRGHKKRIQYQPKQRDSSPYRKLSIADWERKYLEAPQD